MRVGREARRERFLVELRGGLADHLLHAQVLQYRLVDASCTGPLRVFFQVAGSAPVAASVSEPFHAACEFLLLLVLASSSQVHSSSCAVRFIEPVSVVAASAPVASSVPP